MANRTKKSKKKTADPGELVQEQEVKVEVKEIVKDERTHKIVGTISLLICLFLFVAFFSYLFTWREDQDKVFKGSSILFPSAQVKTENWAGNIGAYVSHQFFYYGFGLASFLFCTFFLAFGLNKIFGERVLSLKRNIRYVLLGLVYFSLLFAFLGAQTEFPWGGAAGNYMNDWLTKMAGTLGVIVLLIAVPFAYFIWRKNPRFSMPAKTAVPEKQLTDEIPAILEEEENKEEVVPVKVKGNGLKGNGKMVKPVIEEEEEEEMTLNIIENDDEPPFEPDDEEEEEEEIIPEEPEVIEEPPVLLPKKIEKYVAPSLELEINTTPLSQEEEPLVPVQNTNVLEPYEPTWDLKEYAYPPLDLLTAYANDKVAQDAHELEANKNQIISTLRNYDITIQKISATVGPTVTLYEIVPAAGVRISRIKNLEDDIALSLAALGIRIIAPIPGRGTIGIEVPNAKKSIVGMRALLSSEKFQNNNFSLPIALGKRIDNENFIVDLATMPHLLMAGATGQGKSVGLNAILVSLLYKKHPSQLKFVLVDPKKVELSLYRAIENHFLAKLPGEEEAIITDTKKVINTLNALCIEMDNRYDLLKEAGARNIKEYNEKFVKRKLNPQKGHQFLPFIVLVVDEFADLIMTAGKEVEMPIARLAQLARAVGIHLIIATQRPSVNIITGTIKANFPARIAFKVSSKIDSRTILDIGGAEQLIGKGDMLISYNGELTRLQCAFVDTPEVESICEAIGYQDGYPQAFLLPEYVDEKDTDSKDFDPSDRDPLFEDAAKIIVQNQIGSTSLLQRRMKLGYNRAGRLMDQLEAAGIVGPNQGSKAREVLIKTDMELQQHLETFGY
ncbi:FtsK/SpoIIIE family DNA translocase [Gynurincola endophyticus]|uniref:FtsK/SpoIIIE family DNA translocase n=1 Tax=Gynurincola endophyticus TaxID=2479004 RepID=UPI000F8D941A|nr:DNA translocase FtsK 4TM domain-containing protein [Gynurincola endophyticus]